ncbi:MAG: hypothetical protein HS132_07715 [Planctomycetia bacterium]|nr:hypothetical protein [Planctomycetia bacterium]
MTSCWIEATVVCSGSKIRVVKQEGEVEVRSKDTTWACPECQGTNAYS